MIKNKITSKPIFTKYGWKAKGIENGKEIVYSVYDETATQEEIKNNFKEVKELFNKNI